MHFFNAALTVTAAISVTVTCLALFAAACIANISTAIYSNIGFPRSLDVGIGNMRHVRFMSLFYEKKIEMAFL